MKKVTIKKMLALCLTSAVLMCVPLSACAEEDELEALKEQLNALESENAELQNRIEQLESGDSDTQDKSEDSESAEAEEEAETETVQTEIIGTEYTDSSIIQMVQQALNDAGYECGTADGVAGSNTVEAINSYEKEKGLNVNGVVTDELLESLGIADAVAEAAENEAKMKEYSSEYTYTQIARDPDSYMDEKMTFSGKVLQVGDYLSDMKYVRLAADSNSDTVIYVTYDKDIVPYNILEDDIISVYGTCLGEYTYKSVLGNAITIPWLSADIIDMSNVDM